MTWVVPLALGALAITLMTVVSAIAGRRARRRHAQPAANAGPRILVHDINDDRCTGCDACVAVCPTNVLDLVNNKSRVLRFHDCIQCEACMWACPTEALVMFPEGATPPPLKVPEIDADYQTKVPGQYLIGEVAGKPLVKNAANLGRAVVEHMLAGGLRVGGGARDGDATSVDVAIVGSGPGGLSAALTCMQRGLSYVVLEKEQQIASTIARYPKGKLVMAEPYDTDNMSFLPVFDSSKEQIVPIWEDLIARTKLAVKLGEAVESVKQLDGGGFDIRTTVAAYRAQRVVLATGTRGKPRTLQVPGENLPKVVNLLDDPAEFRGKSVLVVGGGDSAVEAALAMADAGAKVMISYRGRAFNRAQPKNKQAIESYAAQNKLKVKLQSQVVSFEAESVILQLADGSQKRYNNHAAFVLIGADPPIAWLEKLGVKFVERPHQFQLGKSDDYVRRLVPDAAECAQDPALAAAVVLGERAPAGDRAMAAVALPAAARREQKDGGEATGAKKWLKSASSIFTQSKKLDQPMPLSEFAKRQRTHSGQGRRDALSPGERTRVLRMLRDVGGRLADEESQVSMLEPSGLSQLGSPGYSSELSPPPELRVERLPGVQPPLHLDDEVPAKQAVIVGLAKAMSKGPTSARPRRPSGAHNASGTPPQALPAGAQPPPIRVKRPSAAPPRPPAPPSWQDEPTRQVGADAAADLLRQVRGDAPTRKPPAPGRVAPSGFDDEATRALDAAHGAIDLGQRAESRKYPALPATPGEDATAFNDVSELIRAEKARAKPPTRPPPPPSKLPMPARGGQATFGDEATRVADEDRPRSLSDVEWDLD